MAKSEQKKNVMISYQWDSQKEAIQIKETLDKLGYQVWMDIEEMHGNIYKKMSDGVENTDVMIVCMSNRYEVSENCNRELQYAQDLRKKIVPIKFEKDYNPHGPLGLIVSGAVYVDFSDCSAFDLKINELVAEIKDLKAQHGIEKSDCATNDMFKGAKFTSHVPSQVHQFTGREKDIECILQDIQSNQLVIITGPPGIGKTSIAVEAAHQLLLNNPSLILIFFDLRSIDSVDSIVTKMLRHFSKTPRDKPIEQLYNVLNSIKSEIVLLFDNAEDVLTEQLKKPFLDLIKETLRCTHVKLLCTSRVKFYLLGINCKEEILQGLEIENALSFLSSVVPQVSTEVARKLAMLCGCAPLALWILANLIKDGGYSPDGLIEEIALNAAKPIDGYYLECLPEDCQLEAVINSSYVRLSPELQHAFCCLSVFPSTFDIEAAKSIVNVPNIVRTLATLKGRSLLSHEPLSGRYSVHSYVRAFAKCRKEYDMKHTRIRFEMYFVQKLLDLSNIYYSRDFMLAVRDIIIENANITEMLTFITGNKELYKLCRQLACKVTVKFIYMFIPVDCFLTFYTELSKVAKQTKDTRTESMSLFCLAYHYRDVEQYQNAADILKIALSKYGKRGPDIFFVPLCNSYMALFYGKNKLYNESEVTKYIKKTKKFLASTKKGKQSVEMAMLLSTTAIAVQKGDSYDEAIDLSLAALQIWQDMLGNHLATAQELYNLGSFHTHLAKLKSQREQRNSLLETSLSYSIRSGNIYENIIGNNQETADSMFLSGLICFRLDRFQQSSDFFKKSVDIQEVLYGPDSYKVIKARYIKEMADNSVRAENVRLKFSHQTK